MALNLAAPAKGAWRSLGAQQGNDGARKNFDKSA